MATDALLTLRLQNTVDKASGWCCASFYIQSVVDASAKSKSLSIDLGLAQKRFWFSIETTDLFDPFKALNLPYLWRGTDGCTATCQLGFTLDNSTHWTEICDFAWC